MTYSDVASQAGVGRQLLYRWWPNKQDLVAEALFDHTDASWPTHFPGPLERDLRSFVSALVDYARRPDVLSGVAGLIADARDRPTPLPGLEEGFLQPLRRSFGLLLAEGQARGEVRGDLDLVMTLDTIRGAAMLHVLDAQRSRKKVIDHLVAIFAPALAEP